MKKIYLGELMRRNREGWAAIFLLFSLIAGAFCGITFIHGFDIATGPGFDLVFGLGGFALVAFLVPPLGYIFAAGIMAVCLYEMRSLLNIGGFLASLIMFAAGAILLTWMWPASLLFIAISASIAITAHRKMPKPEPVGEIPMVREFPKPKS